MSERLPTIQQHEPLRTPEGWSNQEKALISQLEQTFDDLYRRFGRLRMSDLGKELKNVIQEGQSTLEVLDGTINAIVEGGLETSALLIDQDGLIITGGRAYIVAANAQQSILLNSDGAAFRGTSITLTGGSISLASGGDLSLGSGSDLKMLGGNISMIGSGGITLNGAGGISLVGGGAISLQGAGGISIAGTGNLTLNGGNIALTGGGNITLSGGKLIITTGNFQLDSVGNVTLKNASVSGVLRSNGSAVLTKADIVVSSSEPVSPSSGMIWIKPGSGESGQGSTQNYSQSVNSDSLFSNWNSGQTMRGQGGGSSTATGPYKYTLRFTYKITTNSSALRARTLTVYLSGGGSTISAQRTLETGEGLHSVSLTIGSNSSWIATGNSVTLMMTLSASTVADPYAYHYIPPGEISLTCTAQGDSGGSVSDGWVSAEVRVYQ